MMEPTLTQNSALYFVQHKIRVPHISLLQRLRVAVAKRKDAAEQEELRGNVFRWPRIQWHA
jgi:hypothetical protein